MNKVDELRKLIEFLDENEMDLISCGCCDGIGIIIEDRDISDMTIRSKEDMKTLLERLENK